MNISGLPCPFQSSGSTVTVTFTSGSQDESGGFQLMYHSMDVNQAPEHIPTGNALYSHAPMHYIILLGEFNESMIAK